MSLIECAACGHYAWEPDDLWLRVVALNPQGLAGAAGTTLCSPRCAVTWLEQRHRPVGLGVAL